MDSSKLKFFIIGGVLVAILAIAVLFLVFQDGSGPGSSYPKSVQQAINSPVSKNGNWSTLVNTEEYQISYTSDKGADSFFITINSAPVVAVSQKAEQDLLSKLGVDKEQACKLPVAINVTSNAGPGLTGFNFGLSFCPDVPHITDVPQPTPVNRTKDPGA